MYPIHSVTPMSGMKPEKLKELFGMSELPESDKALDPNRLPDETLEEFSYDGLEFEEAAAQIWNHLTILHYHAGTYNRQSEWFPVACRQLEKIIRVAGSFCLTKTVLEAGGAEFPKLKTMNLPALYGLTSYYFRKCGKAFDDIYANAGLISIPMHNWELRWLALGERIKATEDKCRKIREGRIKIETLLERERQCHGKNSAGPSKAVREPRDLQVWTRALPLLDSYARQIKRERKHEDRVRYYSDKILRMQEEHQLEIVKEEARKQKAEMKNKAVSGRSAGPSDPRKNEKTAPAPNQKAPGGAENMSLPELRKALIEKAKERGEESEIMKIIGDPPEKLHDRWRRYRQEDERRKNNYRNNPIKKKKKRR